MTYDFIVEPKLIGLRFDSYQGAQEGSPVVGYLISMQSTHYDSLDNLDGDSKANVTYVAYSDLYDGFPSQFTGAVCYGAGTRLRTIQGEIAIEDLSVGDLLWTIVAGYQLIVWIGKRTLPPAELAHKPHLRAIRVSAHALLGSQPTRTRSYPVPAAPFAPVSKHYRTHTETSGLGQCQGFIAARGR